jgi:hypothetical protein
MAIRECTIARNHERRKERQMTKAPAMLTPGLIATKGQAAPAADVPTRSPALATPAKPKNDTPLNFKMSDNFVLSFKARAVQDRLKLNELLEKCFAAYCLANPK